MHGYLKNLTRLLWTVANLLLLIWLLLLHLPRLLGLLWQIGGQLYLVCAGGG